MAFLVILPLFKAYFLEFMTDFAKGLLLANNFGDLNFFLGHIFAIFSCFFLCFLAVFLYFGHFVGDSKQLFAYFSQFKD